MRGNLIPVAFIICALMSTTLLAADDDTTKADLYVSPQGRDSNPGTLDKPLATLDAAIEAIRKLRAAAPARKTPVVVMVRDGMYPIKNTLTFVPADSGTKDSPTIFRALPKENPVISGGTVIKGWKVNGKGWWEVTLGEVAAGKWAFAQLWVDGHRRYRPRAPEKGYYVIGGQVPPTVPQRWGSDRFAFNDKDIDPKWHSLGDIDLILMNSWNTGRFHIAGVEGNVVTTTGGGAGGSWWMGFRAKRRYLLENVRESLARPGQWYLNSTSGLLTYIPMEGETPDKSIVIAPRVEHLLRITGDVVKGRFVEYLQFHGLTFAYSNWTLPKNGSRAFQQCELDTGSALKAVAARHCIFKACRIEHTGQYGLEFNVGCKENLVEDCELTDLGAGGIRVGSTHDAGYFVDEKLPIPVTDEVAASHNTIRNCLIARGGRIHPGGVGVWIGQAHRNTVEHCDIFDFYYTGINIGWCWGEGGVLNHDNTVAFNLIHDIGQGVLADMAGIYTLGHSKGTVVRNNVIHDVSSYRGVQGCGIYTDAGSSFYTFENNLVYHTNDGAYHHHFGRENIVRNNIFALNYGTLKQTKPENHRSFIFTNNIVYWSHGAPFVGDWGGKWEAHHNLFWTTRGKQIKPLRGDKDSICEDPMFVDPEKLDFHLKGGSPAEKIGFKPFDYTQAGRLEGFKRASDLAPEPRAFDTFKL